MMYCKTCKKCMLDSVNEKRYHKGLKTVRGPVGVVSKKELKTSSKNYYFDRVICDDCFISAYGRKPKSGSIPNEDYKILYEVPEDILKNAIHFRQAVTLDRMIAKYGEIEGSKRWDEYCNRQAETNKFEYKNKKFGMTKEEFDSYNKSRSVTLKGMIAKYGEIEGSKRWDEYCKRQSYTNTLDYFIKKYGEYEGKKEYENINKRKTNSLKTFIERYGDEGEEKFIKYISRKKVFYSKMASNYFTEIMNEIKDIVNTDKVYFEPLTTEFGMYDKDNEKYYKYDFVISDIKLCIEFNGNNFHGNPDMFNENDTPNPFDRTIKCKDMWEHDKNKMDLMKNEGYLCYTIWESERNNKDLFEEIIEKIKELYDVLIEN